MNREAMTRYREAAYFARARQYGEEAAVKWKAEREAIHQSAWESYDDVQRERTELDSLRIRPLPYKPNYAA